MSDRRRAKEARRRKRKEQKRSDLERQPAATQVAEQVKTPTVGRGRACGECTRCCTLLTVPRMTERNQPCQHECAKGCAIYSHRPSACKGFECTWIAGWGDEDYRPDRCGWMAYADQGSQHLARLAGAGSARRYSVEVRGLREKSELNNPTLARSIAEWVEAKLAVVVMGENETEGRWLCLFGPRLPKGLFQTLEELDRLAEAAEPRCILCASKMRVRPTGERQVHLRCVDERSFGCAVHGPAVDEAQGFEGAARMYNAWAARARVNLPEAPPEASRLE